MWRDDLPFKKRNVSYPFSRARVYFNAVAGLFTLLISASLLLGYSSVLLLACYLFISAFTTFASFRFKLYLLFKMRKIDSETEVYPEEGQSGQKWKIILIAVILALLLLLPVVSTVFLDPVVWFVGFSGVVTGMSLSEVTLYLCVEHS